MAALVDANGGVVRVRLVVVEESETVQVWEADQFTGAETMAQEWVDEVDSLLEALCEDWPVRSIRLQFVAEGNGGTTRGTFLRTVRGKSKEASAKPANDLRAQVDAMASISKTVQHTLEMVNAQVLQSTRVIEAQGEAMNQSTQLIIALRRELESEKAASKPNKLAENADELIKGVLQSLPDLIDMWKNGPAGRPVNGAA
jgi:hypothetical protein